MQKVMIFMKGSTAYFNKCANIECAYSAPKNIPVDQFYSSQQAIHEGWVFTKNIIFCPPDIEGVWVCPDCWEDYSS